jgi:sugar lactone lactonase YvrE
MNVMPDLGRRLREHFQAEAPERAPDRVLQAALATIDVTSQRRVAAPWRISHMFTPVRTVVLAAAILALIVGPISLLPRDSGPGTVTSPSPDALLPAACPADAPLPSGTIVTIAGDGNAAATGDGGPATSASVKVSYDDGGTGSPAIGPDGALYFSDAAALAVRRIGPDGIITTVAGPSTGAPFTQPAGLAFDTAGDLFIADYHGGGHGRIWRMDPSGEITPYAGTGVTGNVGDGVPALEAQVAPVSIAVGPEGDVYLSDNHAYRRIDPQGIIHAFAGDPSAQGDSGDGGPALDARFGAFVQDEAVAPNGDVYLVDIANSRVRKVDRDGIITTIAGGNSGVPDHGDGGPAVDAQLLYPSAVDVDAAGNVYITDVGTSSVRRIDTEGIITTIAGTGAAGYSGDCGPATEAELNQPGGILVHDGVVYILDSFNHRIRMVVP